MSLPNLRTGRRPRGFTLVELLIVLGIILVLVSLLVPLVGKVRMAARVADTRAQIGSLGAMIQAYYNDHSAYPGPFPNASIATAYGSNTVPLPATFPNGDSLTPPMTDSGNLVATTKVTMAENLVLGLLGGLRLNAGGAPAYETAWVGTGPGWLGPTPKKLPPYGDLTNIELRTAGTPAQLTGDFLDGNDVTGDDSEIPEFLDRIPGPKPILYMRARAGQRSTGTSATDNPVVTNGTRVGQYDLTQIQAYTEGTGGVFGEGADWLNIEWYSASKTPIGPPKPGSTDSAAPKPYHGLREVTANSVTNKDAHTGATPYFYPYDLYAALRHPSIPNTPKQKDTFVLISAGADRIYGTDDDITNFGSY